MASLMNTKNNEGKARGRQRRGTALLDIRITVMLTHDKDITRKGNYRPVLFLSINAKYLITLLANQLVQHIK